MTAPLRVWARYINGEPVLLDDVDPLAPLLGATEHVAIPVAEWEAREAELAAARAIIEAAYEALKVFTVSPSSRPFWKLYGLWVSK